MGCSYVITKKPIGEVINIKEEMSEESPQYQIDGIWAGDTVVFAKVLEDGKTIKIGAVVWDEVKKEFKIKSQEILLSKLGEKTYINKKAEDKNGYYIAALGSSFADSKSGTPVDIIVFYPNGDEFKKAIQEGKLAGKIEDIKYGGSYIYIESLPEKLESFIKENHNKLFNFETPTVYRKVRNIDWSE